MIKSLTLIFLSLSLLSGCSLLGSAKDTRKLVADGLTPKELYEQAESKVFAGSIDQAIEKYELIVASYPDSKYAIQARLDIAYNLYKRKKYNRAILELNQFIKKYPDRVPTPYAYYLRGVIAEAKSKSALDKIITESAQRDVESIGDAYKYYVLLIEDFPDSKYSLEESEIGYKNFCVVEIFINSIEWLYLAAKGHRRAYFSLKNNSLDKKWLIP